MTLATRFGAALGAVLLLAAPAALAQAPTVNPPLDADARRAAVEAAATRMRTAYVFPDVGVAAAAKIERALAAGAYDRLTDPNDFADKLTADLREVTHDKHITVRANGPPRAAPGRAPPPPSEGGIVRADRLAGGVGYIEIVGFPPPGAFKSALDRAMASVADAPALIIDIRRNGGGSPQSVAYLVSHFVDGAKPMLINAFYGRTPGTIQFTRRDSFTAPTPVSYLGRPIYVLTSARTFSGGEEFAYDMQAFSLGTLVGETTGGGANPGGAGPITPRFGMFTPDGRPVNPVTGTNWEGVGVKPDIATPPADALKVALQKLGQSPDSGEIDTLTQARLFEPRNVAKPGGEAAVRTLVEGLASGAPKYEAMTPDVARITREQLSGLTPRFAKLGAVQTVAFKGVGPGGLDQYDVRGADGAILVSISLTADGKLEAVGLPPGP